MAEDIKMQESFTKSDIIIRSASVSDAREILDIYAPYITDTAITFEYDIPSIEEFSQRIESTLKKYPYIVAIMDGKIVGYAYAGVFKNRAAYNHCVETSIYIKMGLQGKGIGTILYDELEKRLKAMGIINVNACITWRDDEGKYLTHQSPEFHSRRGYTRVAHFHKCGYKFGEWFDMIWMEKFIAPHEK